MPEPVAPLPDPRPTATPLHPSSDGTVPPMPSEVTKQHTSTQRPAAANGLRKAMMPLRKMMRRGPGRP
jgi:hypothetical protein